jgi:hypothetical protein
MLELLYAEMRVNEMKQRAEQANRTAWQYDGSGVGSKATKFRRWSAGFTLNRLRMYVRFELDWR